MVQGLISLKFAMLRNSSAGMRHVGWFLGALFVVATWAAAVVSSDASVRHSVLTLIFAGWLLGAMIGPVMLSGSGVLRADYFALLPLSRATLGRGLLATVFCWRRSNVCVVSAACRGLARGTNRYRRGRGGRRGGIAHLGVRHHDVTSGVRPTGFSDALKTGY